MEVQVSVVIVNFNSRELVTRAVRAALASTVSVEVIVIDNCSTDNSLRRLRLEYGSDSRVRIRRNRRNSGFARGCNRGIGIAHGRYLLFLNPDCMVRPETIARMIFHMERYPEVGMAGCTVRNPDGSEQAGSRRNVPTPWLSAVQVLHLDRLFPGHPRFNSFCRIRDPLPKHPEFVEAISGAFMFVRRAALQQVGPFDKRYFLHCEDLDWCVRFRQKGWKILYVPDIDVLHHGSACSVDTPYAVLWHKHRGMVRFYDKFFRRQYPLPLKVIVISSIWCRFVLLAGQQAVRHTIDRSVRLAKKPKKKSQVMQYFHVFRSDYRGDYAAFAAISHRQVEVTVRVFSRFS